MLSDGAAFTTQSRSSLRSYANNFIIAGVQHAVNVKQIHLLNIFAERCMKYKGHNVHISVLEVDS